jgi:hypothetical protein
MEEVSLRDAPPEFKVALLRELGYDTDGTWVLTREGKKHVDPYSDKPVRLDRMVVLPGSALVLDDNPLSIASYFEDHPDPEEVGESI